MRSIKPILLLVALVFSGYVLKEGVSKLPGSSTPEASIPVEQSAPPRTGQELGSDAQLWQAFQNRQSNLQIEGQGRVSKILRDDTDGSPHQRFLLQTATGQTLLVAHNIELAPRIMDIATGDTVRFYGEYEWNEKGGVIHWTHHDPAARHPGGWLEHRGQRYE